MEPIASKKRFYELWNSGELGNKPRTWKTYEDLKQSGFAGTVAIRRCSGSGGSGPFIPNLRPEQVSAELDNLVRKCWSPKDFQFSEQLTPGALRYHISGEIIRTVEGLALYYSTANKLPQDALNSSGTQVFGLRSQMVLNHLLWPADREALMELHDRYPDHVIEFSGFNRLVGIIPGRRMVIWEVRRY